MRTALIALALAGTLVVSGCSDDEPADEPSTAEKSESGDSSVIGAGSDIPNDVEARGDVQVTSCRRTGARVEVGYRVRNTTEEPARYELALRVASAKNGAVWGRAAIQTQSIDAGKSDKLSETVRLDLAGTPKKQRASKVNCIFVAVSRAQG